MPTFMAYKRGQKLSEILGSNPENLKVCINSPDTQSPPSFFIRHASRMCSSFSLLHCLLSRTIY